MSQGAIKAKVIATGEIVEVKAWKGSSDIFFTTLDMNHFYQKSDIELIPIEEPVIVVSRLKEVLKQATEVGYINQYGAHRIIDLVMNDFGKEVNFPTKDLPKSEEKQ